MTDQAMNEKYGFKTDISGMNDEQVFKYAETLLIDDDFDLLEDSEDLIDSPEAVKLLTYLSTEKNHSNAQNNLGDLYSAGEIVEKDYITAFKFYKKAAEQGNSNGQNHLGNCYANGNGVEQNHEIAFKYYENASKQGNKYAQHNLGICYANGEGVEKDLMKGVKLIFTAVASDDSLSAYSLLFSKSESIEILGLLADAFCQAGIQPTEEYVSTTMKVLEPLILKELDGLNPF